MTTRYVIKKKKKKISCAGTPEHIWSQRTSFVIIIIGEFLSVSQYCIFILAKFGGRIKAMDVLERIVETA